MNELHETFDDIAAEITPIDPPVNRVMRRGRRMRNGRRMAAVAGSAGAMALVVGAALGIPALASHPAGQGGAAGPASGPGTTIIVKPIADVFRVRPVLSFAPVLFFAPYGGTSAYGDASLVNATTMKLFDRLVCTPTSNPNVVNDSWKKTVGYSTSGAPVNYASQVVSCDAAGDKYVLGPAVFSGSDITAKAVPLQNNAQYVVNITLDGKATAAFSTLTQKLYNDYYEPYSQSGGRDVNDQVLAEIAIVLDGDVQSAPVVVAPIAHGQMQITGPQPHGFTEAQAKDWASAL